MAVGIATPSSRAQAGTDKIYWTSSLVQRANLDGSDVETLVNQSGLHREIELDPNGGDA